MDEDLRPELYKWQRITSKSNRPSYKKQVKTEAVTNDIEHWIKKVEQASDFAAAQTFGNARQVNSTKASILQTVDQLHDHDAAYDEAQELLNDWVQGQLHTLEDHSTEAAIWSDDDTSETSFEPSIQNIIQQTDAGALSMEEYDRLMNLDNYNEHAAAENILNELRKKEVVRPDFLQDLGEIGGLPTASKPKKDPSIKMQVRQNQVKVNRDKRRLEVKKKQEQEAVRKEALSTAKQKAAEDRRKAAQKVKQEELEIQKEMARIKKELQEERKEQMRKQEEERELEKRIALVARAQVKTKRLAEEASQQHSINVALDNEKKQKLTRAIEVAEARHVGHNLKIMRCCFNRWFDVVLERRLQLGKARAVADWKRLFRAWNSWRHFTRECTLERLKVQHENNMIEDHRKLHQSHAHYEKKLLRKYWLQWHIWLAQGRQARELANGQNSVREKMSAFLAAGKKLAQPKKQTVQSLSADSHLHQSQVDEMFERPANSRAVHRPPSSKTKNLPTEAWQVTRKHLKLTSKQISELTDTPQDTKPSTDAFVEATTDVSSIPSAVGNAPKSFQNRFNAQQKILQEQQKALKEQKQMIEDLKFKQDRNLLEEQIKQQQIIQQQLEKLTKLTLEDKKLDAAVPRTKSRMEDTAEEPEQPQTSRSQLSSVSRITSAPSAFSKKMEERSVQRAKAKQEREERRRKQEEERIAEMVAKEEELRQQEAEERKKRVEAYKEKKRLEKERELELQMMKERASANQHKADEHSRLRVMKYYGFKQLKQHCDSMRCHRTEAKKKHTISLLRQTFQLWRLRYDANEAIRNEKADNMYHRHLVKRYFTSWTQWRLQSQILSTKADRHFQSKLLSDVFRAWLDITTREKIEMWEKERRARQHDLLRLRTWAFTIWKHLPEEKRVEEEKEKRRQEMRRKVANLIPDFKS